MLPPIAKLCAQVRSNQDLIAYRSREASADSGNAARTIMRLTIVLAVAAFSSGCRSGVAVHFTRTSELSSIYILFSVGP